MTKKAKNKTLVIGWDAADWKVILPLIEQGKMPALERLMKRGVHGRIQTLDPPLSPMLWTSIATGVRADKHGIGGFVEPTPSGDGLRPVTTTSRKVKAIWNIFNQEGWKSNVVAWWPSNPAEPINGVMVSNLYQLANKDDQTSWDLPNGTVHPEALTDTLKDFRVHHSEITLAMAIPFIPNLAHDMELRKASKTKTILKIIANTASVHSAATYLMQETEWDFMAVYYDAIDHFCHAGMRYFPPRRPEIPEDDYENYKGVVEAGYLFHDMLLDRTLDLVDEDTTIVLISDHGFHSDHQRPLYIPREPSGPAVEHSPYGIFVMAGPGVKKDEQISGASIVDVTPTILYHTGLAVGKDMEGKILFQCFENPEAPKMIESWENVEGDSGQHSVMLREDPWAAQEALQQLIDLGYIDAIEDDKLNQVEKSKRESDYYIARNMIDGGRINQAIEVLERIFEESKILRYGQRLAFAYLSKKMYVKCEEVLNQLKSIDAEMRTEQENTSIYSDDPFGNVEMEEPMYLDYIEGLLNLAINRLRIALPILERVQKKNPNNLQLALNIAQIHVQRKNYKAAENQFITALAIDERSTGAHYGLGLCFLKQNKYNEAIEEFLIALEQDFFQAHIHYHLGEALVKTENFEDAAQAFEVCIRMLPGMTKAHKWLFELYSKHLNQAEKAEQCANFLKNNIRGEIIVCTGVDGCNYDLFLEMLQEGGIEKGVKFEDFEKTGTDEDTRNWLIASIGKAVYVPSRSVSELPQTYNYKVIYLEQDLNEILENRSKKGKKKKAVLLNVINSISKEKFVIDSWLQSLATQHLLMISWDELLENTSEQTDVLSEFLNRKLNLNLIEKNLEKVSLFEN